MIRPALPFWNNCSFPCPEARGPRGLAGPQVFRSKASLHVYSHMGPWSLVLPMLVVVVVVVVFVEVRSGEEHRRFGKERSIGDGNRYSL